MNNYSRMLNIGKKMIKAGDKIGQQWTKRQIHDAHKKNELIKVRPGRFIQVDDLQQMDKTEQQLLRIFAAYDALRHKQIISHTSAALLHGLWVWNRHKTVHFLVRKNERRHDAEVQFHRYQEVGAHGRLGEFLISSPERCTIDCLRTLPEKEGIAIVDSALKNGVSKATLTAELDKAQARTGMRKARELIDFSDAKSESAGESYCRWALLELGMPAPILQKELFYEERHFRPDFVFEEFGLIVEFDGMQKYDGRYGNTRQVIEQEKVRANILERHGWKVVRLFWRDLSDSYRLHDIFQPYLSSKELKVTDGA